MVMSISKSPTLNSPELKLLILCAGNFQNEKAFSGSARNLFIALEKRNCVYQKVNIGGNSYAEGRLPTRLFRKVDRFGFEDRFRSNSKLAYTLNSLRAKKTVSKYPDFNACLIYGTYFDLNIQTPLYCYFDATVAQVANAKKWGFAKASNRTLNRIFEDQKKLFHKCSAIFPRSEWAAKSVIEDYDLSREKICVASAGVNFQLEPYPHQSYDRQSILFIGREFELKGGPLILDAFRQTRQKLPHARLVIIGCTPDIKEPGVEIIGSISKDVSGGMDKLLTYYSEASIFCLMSNFEAFGISLVEAMHCGVPCVVPKRYAFPEIIVDNVTGRHIEKPDAYNLSQVFIDLLSDPSRLKKMGDAGQQHVQQNYTWDEAARRIHERIQKDLFKPSKV